MTATYDAFISYSHEQDSDLAAALHTRLETSAGSWRRRRRLRVFRDLANLSATPGLWQTIEESLARSSWFILLASPASACSDWVNREVAWWLDNRPADRLLIALTAGTISWTGEDFDWSVTDSLSPSLAGRFSREPLWADLRPYVGKDGPRRLGDIVADIAAPVLSVDKDTLVGEHLKQRRRTTRVLVSVVAALCVLLLTAVVAFVDARRQTGRAERQAAIATSRQLRTLSEAALPTDPRTAIGLGLAAHRLYPAAESKHAVFRALAETRYISTLSGHRERITEVVLASPGRLRRPRHFQPRRHHAGGG